MRVRRGVLTHAHTFPHPAATPKLSPKLGFVSCGFLQVREQPLLKLVRRREGRPRACCRRFNHFLQPSSRCILQARAWRPVLFSLSTLRPIRSASLDIITRRVASGRDPCDDWNWAMLTGFPVPRSRVSHSQDAEFQTCLSRTTRPEG